MDIPYAPILRRPPYLEILENRKQIERNVSEPLDMSFIVRIGHIQVVEVAAPVLITWNDGKSRLFEDFKAMNKYTKAERYPITLICWKKSKKLQRWIAGRVLTRMKLNQTP
ncbi:hypothetical protein O181_088683 [Austropuccinia psidii MF-1]|uniref:Uncharacterized protein n=1 Tax=Austropuccinia psidii MF-1 TaxID=1389203 RepID=A0A9Q3IS13_9BASI|nr:hypothetical protein [Austropuccinia psidii MF-1]